MENQETKLKHDYFTIAKEAYKFYSTGFSQALILLYFSYLLITEIFFPAPFNSKVMWYAIDIIVIAYFARIEYIIAVRKIKERKKN